jgi:hypothetical protein
MSANRHQLSPAGIARFVFACATLAALVWFAHQLVSIAFRLGTRLGIRSAAAIALPLLAGGYGYVSGRHSLRRIRALPLAVRFALAFAAGALALASVPWFLPLMPIPASELWISSCIAALALAFASDPRGSIALFYGTAAGMIIYVAVLGVPRVVP